jgi:hypothetical protein
VVILRGHPILAYWSVAAVLLLPPGPSWAADHAHGPTATYTEWSANVRDEATGEMSPIGTITVPKKWGGLGNWSVMWSERYADPEVRTCDDSVIPALPMHSSPRN